jgi:hypothetical protein
MPGVSTRRLVGGRAVWALGADPGKTGAAVLLSPELEVFAATWSAPPFGPHVRQLLLRAVEGACGAVERINPHRGKGRGLGTLYEAAGPLVDAMREYGVEPGRPDPNRWRSDILGLASGTSADTAERIALEAVRGDRQRGRRTQVVLPLQWSAPTGHAAEALCMALWAAGWRLE